MEITSIGNPKIKEIRALLSKKGRAEQGRFIVEGAKCVAEGITCAPELLCTLLVDKGCAWEYGALLQRAEALGVPCYIVTSAVLEAVSDVKTPQGVAAVFRMPAERTAGRFLVALDGLQDPSNVGAILRTADAAGADGLILSEDCADIYAPRAVRASMGSLFHIGTAQADLALQLNRLKDEGFTLVAAHLKGSENIYWDGMEKLCLVIGNEARGIRPEIMALCTLAVRIPIYGRAESLNAAVAAGILLYDIARGRRPAG